MNALTIDKPDSASFRRLACAAGVLAVALLPRLANAQAASVDTDRPEDAAASAPENTFTWYTPTPADAALAPEGESVKIGSAIVATNYFVQGSLRDFGTEVLGRCCWKDFAFTAGFFLPNLWLDIGFDAGRNAGVPVGNRTAARQIRVLVPDLEVRFATNFSDLLLGVGSGLTGIRIAQCPFKFDLRLPTVMVWLPVAEHPLPSISVGAALEAGYLF